MTTNIPDETAETVIVKPVTTTTAESLALLELIAAEQDRRAAAIKTGDTFYDAFGERQTVREAHDKYVVLIDELGFTCSARRDAIVRLVADGVWIDGSSALMMPALGNVMIPVSPKDLRP